MAERVIAEAICVRLWWVRVVCREMVDSKMEGGVDGRGRRVVDGIAMVRRGWVDDMMDAGTATHERTATVQWLMAA